jgi:hypothetical protein
MAVKTILFCRIVGIGRCDRLLDVLVTGKAEIRRGGLQVFVLLVAVHVVTAGAAGIHRCVQGEVARGQGFGMALAAELVGFIPEQVFPRRTVGVVAQRAPLILNGGVGIVGVLRDIMTVLAQRRFFFGEGGGVRGHTGIPGCLLLQGDLVAGGAALIQGIVAYRTGHHILVTAQTGGIFLLLCPGVPGPDQKGEQREYTPSSAHRRLLSSMIFRVRCSRSEETLST